jgi:hypothetical protein
LKFGERENKTFVSSSKKRRKTTKMELETNILFSLSPKHLFKILIGAIKS